MVWGVLSEVSSETQWAAWTVNTAPEGASFSHLADSHTGSQLSGAIFQKMYTTFRFSNSCFHGF